MSDRPGRRRRRELEETLSGQGFTREEIHWTREVSMEEMHELASSNPECSSALRELWFISQAREVEEKLCKFSSNWSLTIKSSPFS